MDLAQAIRHCRPNARWSLAGNDYANLIWHDNRETKPTLEECQAAWEELLNASKGWPNVQQFMEAFTMPEKAAVSLSQDATIAALRLTLSTWFGRVEVQDERVQLGLNRMVQLGLISAERKAEIEAQAA